MDYFVTTLSRALLLAGLGYLGLYVYGLVMGVFAPAEMVGFTVLALGVLAVYAVHVIRVRRAMRDMPRDEIARDMHRQRERRGF